MRTSRSCKKCAAVSAAVMSAPVLSHNTRHHFSNPDSFEYVFHFLLFVDLISSFICCHSRHLRFASRNTRLTERRLFLLRVLSGKNRRLSSIFDLCWRNEVSNFRWRKFEEVEPFCDLYEADVDINTKNSLDNSGSNETMQKVLASIV